MSDVQFIGRYVWESDANNFGGLSAIHVSKNGTDFIAVGDRGTTIEGRFIRDADAITGLTHGPVRPLFFHTGERVFYPMSDSEGVAVGKDGTTYIAFEGFTRLAAYPDLNAPAEWIPRRDEFEEFQGNASLEALAIGPDGGLWTMPERTGRYTVPYPVFRYHNKTWDIPFEIQRRGPFVVAGADIGPDQRLYVLERDFAGIGFRSRVRRFELDGSGEEVLFQSRTRQHDNLEGISVWDDGVGLRMTMISDDNFQFVQRTEIVEYRITD